MKKFIVSVFLAAVFCGTAICSGVDNFGNKPEEKGLLDNLKQVVIDYHNEEGEDCDHISEQIEYHFISYKKKHNVDAETEKLFEFLRFELYKVHFHYNYLEENKSKDEAVQMLKNWSIYQLLEDWKKEPQKDEAVQRMNSWPAIQSLILKKDWDE